MDGAVEGQTGVGSTDPVRGAVAQEIVPANTAPCFWFQKKGGVAVGMEDHVTGRIADCCARMGGGIVEEPEELIIGQGDSRAWRRRRFSGCGPSLLPSVSTVHHSSRWIWCTAC